MAIAASTSKYFLLFILSTLTISSHGNNLRTLSRDTIFPAPVTLPANNPTPTIVTVPATNPATVTPTTNPASTPLPIPSVTPVGIPPPAANPTNPLAPITVPGGGQQQPITNPVTTYPPPTTGNVPVTNPVVSPPPATTTNNSPPAVAGQSWCVAKTGTAETALQSALDYACGIGGADCSLIQQGGSCYNPNTLQNHASFAFNSYYQKNPSPTSCDFGGTAAIVNTNPSTGTCIYPSSSSSSTSQPSQPSSTTPTPPTPTTIPTPTPTPLTPTPTTIPPPATTTTSPEPGASGSVTPPSVVNSSNPTSIFGSDSPPITNTSTSVSSRGWQQPFIGCITLLTSFVVTGIIIILEM
ncbi:hypothetical protein ACOSQ4_013722 [Xanthoceras sorbifolium]